MMLTADIGHMVDSKSGLRTGDISKDSALLRTHETKTQTPTSTPTRSL
jgi:hypothetical protein